MMRTAVALLVLATWPVWAPAAEEEPVLVIGQIHWPGKDLTNSQIRVFRDAARRDSVGAFPTLDGSGRCLLPLRPGEYWLMAVVDRDGDQKLGPGDGLGFYGVVDPNTSQPSPFKVEPQTFAVLIPISLEMGPEGKLVATGVQEPPPPGPLRWVTVDGRLLNLGETGDAIIYLVPQGGGPCFATSPRGPGGQFVATILAGRYYLFAVQDTNQDDQVGPGDLAAVHGYGLEQGPAFPTTELGDNRGDLLLALDWRIGEGGQLLTRQGEGQGPKMDLPTLPAVIRGHVKNMPEADGRGLARAFRDASLRDEAATAFYSGSDFTLCLPPGLYFVTVSADRDRNDRATPGDWLGFYGVEDLLKSRGPQPLMVHSGEIRRLEIALTASLNAESRPLPLPATPH